MQTTIVLVLFIISIALVLFTYRMFKKYKEYVENTAVRIFIEKYAPQEIKEEMLDTAPATKDNFVSYYVMLFVSAQVLRYLVINFWDLFPEYSLNGKVITFLALLIYVIAYRVYSKSLKRRTSVIALFTWTICLGTATFLAIALITPATRYLVEHFS